MPRCVYLYDEPDLILDTARARVGHHRFEERSDVFVGSLSGCEDRHHPVIGDYHVAERVDAVSVHALASIFQFDMKRRDLPPSQQCAAHQCRSRHDISPLSHRTLWAYCDAANTASAKLLEVNIPRQSR